MKNIYKFGILASLLTFSAFCEFEAKSPVDPEDKNKYGFGSLIKDKSSFLSGIFSNKSKEDENSKTIKTIKDKNKENTNESVNSNDLNSLNPPSNNNNNKHEKNQTKNRDKIWDSAIEVLKDFPLTLADKENGIIETGFAIVPEFDITEVCLYKVKVKINNNDNILVNIESKEDTPLRIKKLTENLKTRILDIK